jgi:hypothetical protein
MTRSQREQFELLLQAPYYGGIVLARAAGAWALRRAQPVAVAVAAVTVLALLPVALLAGWAAGDLLGGRP